MLKFLFQFGHCGLSNHQTGRSRGYAFVEFECDEVAKIVAETMNNYVMFDKLLKCEFLVSQPSTFVEHLLRLCICDTCPAGQFVGVGRVRKHRGRVKEMAIGRRRRWAQKQHNKVSCGGVC